MHLKNNIFNIINDGKSGYSKFKKCFEIFIIILIILSICEIILESYQGISIQFRPQLKIFEITVVVIFSVEYLLRLWIADLKFPLLNKITARIKFMTSPMGIIDLLAILPFYLPLLFKFDLRFLRILRVFRIFRIFQK